MEKTYHLSPTARFLKKHGMESAALFYQSLNETIERRAGRVIRFHLENIDVPTYTEGQRLFATYKDEISTGRKNDDLYDYGCMVDWNGVCYVNEQKFRRLFNQVENEQEHYIVNYVLENARRMYTIPTHIRYDHGGWHHTIDFHTLFAKGLRGYKDDIVEELSKDITEEKRQFLLGMQDTVEGLIQYVERYKVNLKEQYAKNPEDKALESLIIALERVPIEPPVHFYEAFVMLQAGLYLSNCFETGRIDHLLYPYYKKDLERGKTSEEMAYSLFRELFEDIEKRLGHPSAVHVTIGGTDLEGKASYNSLTKIAIIAIRGLRTPNVTLRVREDMPQDIWEEYLENIGKGYGQPAIANEKVFLQGLINQYNVPFKDAINYVFGGCSEVLIQGKTMCDSTWVSYNMLDVFEDTFHTQFIECENFETFYNQFKKHLHLTIQDMGEQINLRQHTEGLHTPTPIKSLLTGDCIKEGKSVLGGGACYNFDSTNIYGSTNTINALYAIKEFYADKFGVLSRESFLDSFIKNYEDNKGIYTKCNEVCKFGNYNEEINKLAEDLMGFVFDEMKKLVGYRKQGQFMPAIIAWTDWISNGQKIGATPDGRKRSEPLADSAGAMQGTDREGPTSLLGATMSIPQKDCIGTCIVNLRLDPKIFKTVEGRQKVKALLETYFAGGGNQLQINVVDKEILEEAMEAPEKHRDIIVRVGGFSDNFVLLDSKIQKEIIKRTQYS